RPRAKADDRCGAALRALAGRVSRVEDSLAEPNGFELPVPNWTALPVRGRRSVTRPARIMLSLSFASVSASRAVSKSYQPERICLRYLERFFPITSTISKRGLGF